eukprot:1147695-Pyramimonas_sp.AAC.1
MKAPWSMFGVGRSFRLACTSGCLEPTQNLECMAPGLQMISWPPGPETRGARALRLSPLAV